MECLIYLRFWRTRTLGAGNIILRRNVQLPFFPRVGDNLQFDGGDDGMICEVNKAHYCVDQKFAAISCDFPAFLDTYELVDLLPLMLKLGWELHLTSAEIFNDRQFAFLKTKKK